MSKRRHNRLIDDQTAALTPKAIKCDERFIAVVNKLMAAGYINFSELVYDAIYYRAMMADASLHLPTIIEVEDEAAQRTAQIDAIGELELELQALRACTPARPITRKFRHSENEQLSQLRSRTARAQDGSHQQQRKVPSGDS